ncbi:MAG: AraC family transcriptional regulator [Pseudomonadota bacterium]
MRAIGTTNEHRDRRHGPAARAAWPGRLEMTAAGARWRGPVGENRPHRHLAAQAVFAGSPATIRDGQGRAWTGRCLLVDPLALHTLEADGDVELVFVEPTRGGALVEPVLAELGARLRDPVIVEAEEPSLRFWRALLAPPEETRRPIAPALLASLETIDAALEDGPVRLAMAAASAGLSPDRYRHAFAEAFGISFRRHLLWRRMARAVGRISGGQDITAAAHATGFADSAHLARTMRACFGISAGRLAATRARQPLRSSGEPTGGA